MPSYGSTSTSPFPIGRDVVYIVVPPSSSKYPKWRRHECTAMLVEQGELERNATNWHPCQYIRRRARSWAHYVLMRTDRQAKIRKGLADTVSAFADYAAVGYRWCRNASHCIGWWNLFGQKAHQRDANALAVCRHGTWRCRPLIGNHDCLFSNMAPCPWSELHASTNLIAIASTIAIAPRPFEIPRRPVVKSWVVDIKIEK